MDGWIHLSMGEKYEHNDLLIAVWNHSDSSHIICRLIVFMYAYSISKFGDDINEKIVCFPLCLSIRWCVGETTYMRSFGSRSLSFQIPRLCLFVMFIYVHDTQKSLSFPCPLFSSPSRVLCVVSGQVVLWSHGVATEDEFIVYEGSTYIYIYLPAPQPLENGCGQGILLDFFWSAGEKIIPIRNAVKMSHLLKRILDRINFVNFPARPSAQRQSLCNGL